jgi:RecB family exonuclease
MYDRLKSPGYSPDAIFGIFIHNILEKIYQTDRIYKDSILLVLEDEWDELRFDSLTQSNEYKKEALNLLNDYFKENPIDQDIRYVLEKEFSAFIGDVEFRGKLDRIDVNTSGEMQIIDYKTSQKKKTQKSIIKDLQLPYYFFLLSRSTDDESKFEISSGKFEYVRHAESPSVEIQLNKDDIDRVEDRVRNISSSVQRSVFTPKKNSICYYCEFKRLLCPLYK